MKPTDIRTVLAERPFVLAPMAGLTTSPFRLLCLEHGAGLALTEMVSAEGIRRKTPATMAYLESLPGEAPLGAHLFGHDPEAFAAAADALRALGRFSFLDINCGCPVRKVTRRGAGAALMKEPDRLAAIVRAAAAFSLPVTVKIRLGLVPGRPLAGEAAAAAVEAGAAAVFLHGRFATARHAGPADHAPAFGLSRTCAVPIVANGGVRDGSAAAELISRGGLAGVMIGRAALGNPWIFEEALAARSGGAWTPPPAAAVMETVARHLEGEIARTRRRIGRVYPGNEQVEAIACRAFLPHLSGYLRGRPGLSDLKRRYFRDVATAVEVLREAEKLLGL
ncbi:MAG TPA: tRNA-dihydrouridine synthase [bacterium]|nr:tRNA-dihydrouridine synthase [bacterium]